jgi:kinesin family member 2/24
VFFKMVHGDCGMELSLYSTRWCSSPQRQRARAEEEQRNLAAGNPGDVDFIGMVRQWRADHAAEAQPHDASSHRRICICVRKRPISEKEREKNDHDSVTCLNPTAWIHTAKLKVDGITKYLDHSAFTFDHVFDEHVTTEEVYRHTTMPLVDFCVAGMGGRATVFAFGQTGSGKTHTMQGIQDILVEDLFLLLDEEGGCMTADTSVMVSFFEMYGGSIQDLLNRRERLKILEDGKGEINVTGLTELPASTPEQLMSILQAGNMERTTHVTEANDTSSRSHAICQIILRDRSTDRLRGKLSLVDLAGSERGADTKSHNAQRRGESAEINTSLLALKECIRALDDSMKKGDKHVPYRSSKLTLILKDCFTSDSSMTTMIATVRNVYSLFDCK